MYICIYTYKARRPLTQYLRFLVPNVPPSMGFGNRDLKIGYLDPAGLRLLRILITVFLLAVRTLISGASIVLMIMLGLKV